jgi:hypothetical protein
LGKLKLISDNMVIGAIAYKVPCILCTVEVGNEPKLIGDAKSARDPGVLRNSISRQFKSLHVFMIEYWPAMNLESNKHHTPWTTDKRSPCSGVVQKLMWKCSPRGTAFLLSLLALG